MKTFMKCLKEDPILTILVLVVELVFAALTVAVWWMPSNWGYPWWAVLGNLVMTAIIAFAGWAAWMFLDDMTTSYYD